MLRFFTAAVDLAAAAERETRIDQSRSFGLVARAGTGQRLAGQASFFADDGTTAEVAFAVADDYRGRGLGTLLLGQLAEVAAARGIDAFEAIMLPANHRMLGMFRRSGFPVEATTSPDRPCLAFPTSLGEEARALRPARCSRQRATGTTQPVTHG